MMLRRDCLDEVGLFDERYFSYCEEADLALRARRAGWKVGLVRGARVQNIHLGLRRWRWWTTCRPATRCCWSRR